MLINAQLPIDINRLQEQNQTFSLAGMSWDDYEQFKTAEYPGYRVSFFSGVITLVSPSKNHERIRETMAILIVAYCRKFNLPYFPWGSTRLTNKPNAGKEPDLAYCFGMDKDIPDLAIEVVFSSGGVEDLIKYQSIGVSEVWFWQDLKKLFKDKNFESLSTWRQQLFEEINSLTTSALHSLTGWTYLLAIEPSLKKVPAFS